MKVAVIGCGYWGPKLVRNFQAILGEGMRAVADVDKDRLRDIRTHYPQLDTHETPNEVIDRSDIDAVAIATPVETHYELARYAIESGKHVLVEKPLTDSTDASRQLIELAQAAGVTLMVDHTFIYTGAVRKLRELVDTGELGDLYYFDSVRVNLGLFQHDINVLWDLAPHDVSIMDHVLQQEPEAVAAHGVAHFQYADRPIEDIAYLTVYYSDSLIGHIHVNWMAPVKVRKTLICGSNKMIVYDDTDPLEKVKVYDKGIQFQPNDDPNKIYQTLVQYRIGDMYAPNLDQREALRAEVEHFVDCAENGKTPETDGHAGLNVVRILEAAQQSLDQGGELVRIAS